MTTRKNVAILDGNVLHCLLTFVLLLAATGSYGQIVIDSFAGNGELSCSGLMPGSICTVEGASSPGGPWTNSWDSLSGVVADSNGVATVCVPIITGSMFYRLVGTPYTIPNMVYVEGGTFTMGDTWGDGGADELPTHSVTVSSFYMSKCEVTNDEMAEVLNWAEVRGKLTVRNSLVLNDGGNTQVLLDLHSSYCQISWNGFAFVVDAGKGDYPCVEVSWYGAAAYCNYRSEEEGLTPCYDLSDWSCDWNANGYRLPTEAEWEYAARGGRNGSYTKYSGSDNLESVAWYDGNSGGHSHEVGTKTENELGIHDMSGNVWEWCNDWYGSDYYGISPASNPKGPGSGTYRVLRGGGYFGWFDDEHYCCVAYRYWVEPCFSIYTNFSIGVGFRCVR